MSEHPTCSTCGAYLVGASQPCSCGQPGGAGAGWGPHAGHLPATRTRAWRRRTTVAAVGAVATLGLVGAAFVLGRPAREGPSHPDAWDPRVADIAEFVEAERGLTFQQPVFVDFLTPDEYRAAATAADPQPGAADEADRREAGDRYVASLRALGLLEGEPDLGQASDELNDAGTLAYYEPWTERITVRGTELTPGLRVTLAHELTHALQDQSFDLGRAGDMDPWQAEALRAIAEGDAERIEVAYRDGELSDDERTAYQAERQAASDASEAAAGEVPDVMVAGFAAPYIVGGAFVDLLYQLEGAAGIDRALLSPPAIDAELFDPFRYLDGTEPQEVEAPEAPEGAEVTDSSAMGAIDLYLLLASRIDPGEALAAVDGWDGDAMVTSETDGRVCVHLAVTGTDEAATRRFGDALRAWSEAMPGDDDTVDAGDGTVPVRLTSCDPGADAGLAVAPDLTGRLDLPAFRVHLAADAIELRAMRADEAECVGDAMARRVTVDQLADLPTLFGSDDFRTTLGAVTETCER